jgi:hypothetical protein
MFWETRCGRSLAHHRHHGHILIQIHHLLHFFVPFFRMSISTGTVCAVLAETTDRMQFVTAVAKFTAGKMLALFMTVWAGCFLIAVGIISAFNRALLSSLCTSNTLLSLLKALLLLLLLAR